MEVAIRAGALLGECPRWDAATGRLLWVDIESRALHIFDPASGDDRSILFDDRVGVSPGIKFNLYNGTPASSYKAPGPAVWSGAKGGEIGRVGIPGQGPVASAVKHCGQYHF